VPDAVGSTRTLVSAAGTIVGVLVQPLREVLASAGTKSAIGFSGSYTDSITDMDYMTNRWYDPSVGEFISVDPLVAATSQAYEYGEDDPNVYVDTLGLCRASVPVAYCTTRAWQPKSPPLWQQLL